MTTPRTQRILRQHVIADKLLGIETVPASASPRPVTFSPDVDARRITPVADPSPAPLLTPTPLLQTPQDRQTKLKILQAMDANEVQDCTDCELHHGRTQTVFGEGDADATIMFIGEGPGQTEDEQGRPFVGRAGEMLDKWIQAMGYSRKDIYIANVVKCRPPGNRTPSITEVDACSSYLRRQIETIRPQVIVTVGGPATKLVLDTQEGITRLRGQWREYHGVSPAIPVMPTFHPAFLLRSYTKENRQKIWSDLQAVKDRVS